MDFHPKDVYGAERAQYAGSLKFVRLPVDLNGTK